MNKKYILVALVTIYLTLLVLASWNTSMTRDEQETIAAGAQYWSSWNFSRDGQQPPLVKLMVGLPQKAFAQSDYRSRLLLSRFPSMVFSAALAVLIFIVGKKMMGDGAGIIAVLLYVFNTDVLAHAEVATFDLALSFFFLLALFLFHEAITGSSKKIAVYAGFVLGFAFLSKFVAIHLFLLLPTMSLFFLHKRMIAGEDWRKSVVSLVSLTAITIIVASLLIGMVYLGQWNTLVDGLLFQANHAQQGNDAFLMGNYSTKGWWYYFPAVFLIKSPIPLLLLTVAAVLFYKKIPIEVKKNNWYLFLPIAYWWLFMMFINHVNIGIRYLLPVYSLMFLIVAQVFTIPVRKHKLAKKVVSCLLVLWYISISFFAFPHYFSYFNEIIGGPKFGYYYVIDSNIDWGQDLLRLKHYVEKNNLSDIHVDLYGPEEWLFKDYEEITCNTKTGWFAVSVNKYVGFHEGLDRCLNYVRGKEPIDNVGNSILLFHIT